MDSLTPPTSCGEFPNDWTVDRGDRLFAEGRVESLSPPQLSVVLGLLLLCLLPRLWAGTLHDILCPDAVSYIRWTEALEAGEVTTAFQYTGLNIYQPILLGLKKLPGDRLVAAKWWSVAMATLAILPIYGWIRRQFNETLAILGSGLYALHPAMIHDSPLIVRDPTFWLLLALGLYAAWRAVSELHYRWFASFAIVFALAIHLRTEGWLLAPVLSVWVVCRVWRAREGRLAPVVAMILALGAGPIAGIVLQKHIYAQSKKPVIGNMRHLLRAEKLLPLSKKEPATGGTGESGAAEAAKPEAAVTTPKSEVLDGTMDFAVRYGKGFGYLHMILAAIGLAHWKARILGPAKGTLLIFSLLSGAAVWVCFCQMEMDRRYAFPVVIASLPTIAAGLCLSANLCTGAASRSWPRFRTTFSFWLLICIATSGALLSTIIIASPRPLLYDQVEMGRWIRRNLGPGQYIGANIPEVRLLEYYAEGKIGLLLPTEGPSDPQESWVVTREHLPPAILIWLDERNPGGRGPFECGIRKAKSFGYREVPQEELPKESREILVLVRERGVETALRTISK